MLWPFSVSAQSAQAIPCGERGKIIDRLKKVYSEDPASIGVMSNGSIIEVYASPDGTFTVLITAPKGKTCLVASGDSWEDYKYEPIPKGFAV